MLLWDLMHPNDDGTEFKAVAVSGECIVGLADDERQEPCKRLAVLEWCVLAKANVSSDLLRDCEDQDELLKQHKQFLEQRL